MTPRRAALAAGAVLFLVYAATLAPSVTFWDAGEFIAAARVLGIPHPPGTPLFVVPLNAWARLLSFLPFALATNLFSAACTACAAALAARWIARALGDRANAGVIAVAAALTAGGMSSVWFNATETEVYAASLMLAMCAIVCADAAGRSDDRKWLVACAYLLALAVPMHLSALVAAPAVIYLAMRKPDRTDWCAGAALLGVSTVAAGVSRLSVGVTIVGVGLIAASGWGWSRQTIRLPSRTASSILGVSVIALSALAIMLVRARFDPAINQGNPRTLEQLRDVIGRVQYDVAGLWPRRAPAWLQVANWFEYADWQFALSFAPTVIPNVARVAATISFAALAVVGSLWHRDVDRRTWWATAILFVCGSLGVIVYLNLRAGTSFAWPMVPDPDAHEARDRDYFFVLGFWAWGLWAGMGAMRLAAKVRLPVAAGVVVAMLPIAFNWMAVNRSSEPEAGLPRELAHQLLDSLPKRSVLFVAGDNDTYPLWYSQQVEHRRPDVAIITISLLGANWYGDELRRRDGFALGKSEAGEEALLAQLGNAARAAGRPIAASLAVSPDQRAELAPSWTVKGVFAVADPSAQRTNGQRGQAPVTARVLLDSSAMGAATRSIESWLNGRTGKPSTDPVDDYALTLLSCPRLALLKAPSPAQAASLDSLCNLR